MRGAISRLLAVIGAVVVFFFVVALALGVVTWLVQARVPSNTVLEVNLETGLVEDVPDDPVARLLLADQPVLRDVVEALQRAAGDRRVTGLVARLGAAPIGLAQAQEIRDAVAEFRASGKFAVAFAETFGEFGPAGNSYYLATAFDEIWVQPSGDLGLSGMLLEAPFLRGTLDKLGLTPRLDHRHEYKNAKNTFTEKGYTPAHREADQALLNSWFSQTVREIAEARGKTEQEVRELIDRGPFLGQEALEAGLVDGLAYRDEVHSKAKEKAGRNAKTLELRRYLERAGRPHERRGPTIALIYGAGAVHRGKSQFDAIRGQASMGSDTVTAAFRSAIEDNSVKAILFRVDSPGGSYIASDAIWRETVRAREAGKPVVVSMGNLAASGGYFVSMDADKIVAQPGTITGSIGVLGGKMLTTGFWDKLGLSWDSVQAGAHATIWTGTRNYSPSEWARVQAFLDRIYEDFTSKVAGGRDLPKERVLEVAKGRIWTGEDAKDLGLVDELGGFQTALRLAKEAAGIPEPDEIRLIVFPARKSTLDLILEKIYGGDSPDGELVVLRQVLETVQPVARQLSAWTAGGESGVLRLPEAERYIFSK